MNEVWNPFSITMVTIALCVLACIVFLYSPAGNRWLGEKENK
jgi:hypothetical protein